MQLNQSSPSTSASRPRRRRLLLVLCLIAIAAGLLIARPWQGPRVDCSLTIRPDESLQAAIDAAAPGDVICLARGTWSENIVIDKTLTLVGRGAGRTFINAVEFARPVVTISDQGSAPIEVTLQGLTVSGPGGVSGVSIGGSAEAEIKDCVISGRWHGIEVADSARLALSHSTVSGNTQRGVVLSGSARATIKHSSISGNTGLGVWLAGSAEAAFEGCKIADNLGHGFWLRDEARLVLSDSSVYNNRRHGIWLTGRSSAHVLRSEISRSWDQGIAVVDSAAVELTRSDVLSNWHGVEFRGMAQGTIAGTTVSKNRWDGIGIKDSSQVTVADSTVSANGLGIWVGNQADAEIRDCLIHSNSIYGVFAWHESEVRGQGNEFRDNGIDLVGNLSGTLRRPLSERSETVITWPDKRYASLQEAVDALLPGGKLVLEPGMHMAGLTIGTRVSIEAGDGEAVLRARSEAFPVLSLVDGAELHLQGATLSGGSDGLLVSAGASAVLVACTVSGNLQGISLSYESSAQLSNCSIEGNAEGGILAAGAAQVTVTGCSISSSSNYGVAAVDSARATVMDSLVTGSREEAGIVLRGTAQAVLVGNTISGNRRFGVAIFQRPCFPVPWAFRGQITGSSNAFMDNLAGDVCPPALEFLSTAEGGELDLRSSFSG